MEHAYDFYKPDLHSEYPEVDGQLSNTCYLKALDTVYNRYLDKIAKLEGNPNPTLDSFDFFCFHTPYSKLVQKSVGRLAFSDFLRNPDAEQYGAFQQFKGLDLPSTYGNRDVEKAFVAYTKNAYNTKVAPSSLAAKNLGNMYAGSVYGGLASLVSEVPSEQLVCL